MSKLDSKSAMALLWIITGREMGMGFISWVCLLIATVYTIQALYFAFKD